MHWFFWSHLFLCLAYSVGLPPHVWRNSFPSSSSKASFIEVRYIWLPQGSYAKLQPDELGSKALILSSKDQRLGTGIYSIGVYGFKGKIKYQILKTVQENQDRKVGQQAVSFSSPTEMDTVECRNCKHYIPSRTTALHEAYCSRHNVPCQYAGCAVVLRIEAAKNHTHCDKCGHAFHRGEIEKHMKVFHEPLHCPCGVFLEKEQMVQHRTSDCPMRLITCRFCGDMVQAGTFAADVRDRFRGLSEHKSLCESRTAPCDSCGRSVMLKEMDIHRVAVHQNN